MPINKWGNRFIQTYTKKRFYPLAPKLGDIDIEDIAQALSNQCRFTGHSSIFFSVAEHCINVAKKAPPEMKILGLMHDAAEAYLMDLAHPIKMLPELKAYRDMEARIMYEIEKKFNLPPTMNDTICEIDRRMCRTEAMVLMAPLVDGGDDFEPYRDVIIYGWSPSQAKLEFLLMFQKLWKGEIHECAEHI